MIKCQATQDFTLNDFDELSNIQRRSTDKYGKIYKDDLFECDKNMARYLTGNNEKNKNVVKIIEITVD